ncbi:dihydrolipoamide acetyltransferase family protein [Agrococcus sp. SGAir0287]|uniref:dihydrolipoamide acetyltransferase family protein n=1 Tax=Agrococcus sp. SGAir0287 TaxID=2070347 RepID=UPI0010CD0AD3|nr:dihydrolipoamide acetyltransferase family protein [Agrococcus sp. SGAir0287]QCR19910.1 2-oxo acid dehydrogenase subunit E2 [Agrococcus sp. SGAir0287]
MPELALTMPKMSMTMEEGTMVAWLKQPGDAVKNGEPIAEVTTDKVDMEVESPYDGVLARIVAEPDDVVAVGEPIAYITSDSDDLLGGLFDAPASDAADAAPVANAVAEPAAPAPTATSAAPSTGAPGWPAAVPAARTLAGERGVDLAAVQGTGRWGAITVGDVEASSAMPAAAPSPQPTDAPAPAAPPAGGSAPVPVATPASATSAPRSPSDPAAARRRRTRMAVARVMDQSALVPQFTAYVDLDLSRLDAVRKTALGGASWTAILMRMQAQALAESAPVNQTWTDDGPVANPHVGIALAVDSPSGLIAPVFVDPHRGSLADLAASIAETVEQTRAGTLSADRLQGGTSVLSNLGGFGIDRFNALLTPPQSSALSTGSIAQRILVAPDGSFGPRLQCTVGLTLDHRVADGADAARVLQRMRELAANPALLG